MRISRLWTQLARAVRWHRRLLAAIAAGCAVLIALGALSPTPPPTIDVVVAATDIPAGSTLDVGKLRVAHYPREAVPTRSFPTAEALVGKVVAAPLSEGSPVTAMSTVSVELTPGPGELLVPFHVQDGSMLALLQVGDRVTVVSAGGDGQPTTLASRVRVAALPRSNSSGGGLGGSSSGEENLVVVAADPTTAARLAAWSSSQALGIALG